MLMARTADLARLHGSLGRIGFFHLVDRQAIIVVPPFHF